MDFDFYLSEMSVSDQHGGGLTLQRIVGDDLTSIGNFVHVSRFATDLPPAEKFIEKSINLSSVWEGDFIRKMIGRSLAALITNKAFVIRQHAKNVAKSLSERFKDKKQLNVLICPQGATSILALEELKKRAQIKYISWIMDDHVVKFIDGSWQYPNGMEEVFAKHLKEAEHVFVISPAMQKFYKDRFKIESTVLFGSADYAENKKQPDLNIGSPLKIGYFGAVAAWQIDALQSVANSLIDTDTKLHIYSGIESLPEALCVKGVYFEGRLNPEMVLPTMRNYDAVLLPISFLEKMRSMSEFNIATKMSEYLASGVPILAIGPAYAAMIKFLEVNNAAVIVNTNNKQDIKASFNFIRNKILVDEILSNAKSLAVNETGNEPMRNKWLKGVNV